MKSRYAVFLLVLSFQTYAGKYTIDWKYISQHASYDVKTLIDKEDDYQKITYQFSSDFSFTTLMTGNVNPNIDSNVMENSGPTTLTASEGSFSHWVTFQHGTTVLKTVNLLAHMAGTLNGSHESILGNTPVIIPFLPAFMFPGNAEYHRKITGVSTRLLRQNLVHAQVTVQYPSGSNDYNIYLFQDGKYYVVVSHKAFNPNQIAQLVAIHTTATEGSTTTSVANLVTTGMHNTAYQLAVVEADDFQGLTDVAPPLPALLVGETPSESVLPAIEAPPMSTLPTVAQQTEDSNNCTPVVMAAYSSYLSYMATH